MSWFLKYKLHHILFWIVYFVFWINISLHNYGSHLWKAFLATSIYFIGQAGVGYFSIYYLVPRFFFKKKYAIFSATVFTGILLGALFITVGMYSLFYSMFTGGAYQVSFIAYLLYSLLAVFSSTLLFISVRVIKERVQAQKLNSILEKEKTENELKFLKAQTNPHFLFNAINSIYILIEKDPDLAKVTLARFSDMLRYQLYECNFAEVPIEKEIDYLNNYIELEKLRKGTTLSIDYKTGLSLSNFLISPLLIIPFVENAFKHVSNFSDKRNFIDISINYEDGFFKLFVKNSFDRADSWQTKNPAGGIGQDNTKRRLKLIYPDRHDLIINQDDETYFVSLTINIS
ncbi:MAG TPA: histidine kinase [Puia sp.]|jgi:LytS/YehU family sensor histidine kinase|nr:histidine kinase [Puia sp.]